MKTPSSAIKILTVSVFATLIVLFVCYRVGVFDNDSVSQTYSEVNQSNFEANSLNAIDTPVVNKDSLVMDREMMSSSKSMVISRPYKIDTTKKPLTNPNNKSNNNLPTDTTKKKPLKKTTMMSSSKSAYIYEPEPTPDTTKKPKK